MKNLIVIALGIITIIGSCKNEADPQKDHNLIFRFQFDPTQVRLNNAGLASTIPAGHAGQTPTMNKMSAHYIELAQSSSTQLGKGVIVYRAPETTQGGVTAIDFSAGIQAGNGEQFFSVPLKDVSPGDYEYLRVSLAYQNYDVLLHVDSVMNTPAGVITIAQDFSCTVASFVGYNTYLTNYVIKNQRIDVNGNRLQGYWGVESSGSVSGYPFNYYNTGQAPPGATTVVNPIASTSPIPAGSCVVTGPFSGGKLTITGNETKDIIVTVSLSTNKSFEWIDTNSNGKWEPGKGEKIVDMGLRGLISFVNN
jgi:hypothetical protein